MRVVFVLIIALAGGCKRKAVESAEPKVESVGTEPAPTEPAAAEPVRNTQPSTLNAQPGPKMPDGGTINGDPRGPRAADFNRVIDGAMPQLRGCFEHATLPAGDFQVTVHYIVEPPGYTGAVSASGAAPKAVIECCRGVVENLKFPEFRGKKVENDLPVTFKKVVETKTIEIWDAAPKP
jgi:hypothetical protein